MDRLLHIDRYAHRYGVVFGPSRQRPDLFGAARNGWVIAEAKGRSQGIESGLVTKLTDQKRMVKSIGDESPWLAVGCVAAFPPQLDSMKLSAFDPDEPSIDAVDIPLDRDLAALAYYEPFLRALDSSDQTGISTEENAGPLIAIGAGVSIGLEASVERRVRAAVAGESRGLADDLVEMRAGPDPGGSGRSFRDGSAFATTWSGSLTQGDIEAGEVVPSQ